MAGKNHATTTIAVVVDVGWEAVIQRKRNTACFRTSIPDGIFGHISQHTLHLALYIFFSDHIV